MEAIPPVFQDPQQRRLYDYYPKPPLTLPLTPGETDAFPRSFAPPLREIIKHRYWQRGSLYRKMARQVATNARRPSRGKHIFIIRPTTMNRLLDAVASIPSPKSEEARRVLWSMYFQGKTPEEAESMVNSRTLTRHLIRAERMAEVLPADEREKFTIGLPTIKVSNQVLRLGRDGHFDFQPYFDGNVF